MIPVVGSEEGFFVKVGIPEGLDETDGGAEPSNDGPFEIVGLSDGTDVGSLDGLLVGETGLSVGLFVLG